MLLVQATLLIGCSESKPPEPMASVTTVMLESPGYALVNSDEPSTGLQPPSDQYADLLERVNQSGTGTDQALRLLPLPVESELNTPCAECLRFDIDDDGEILPLTDGLLLMRFLFGFSGASLIEGVLTDAAGRQTSAEISDFLGENQALFDIDGDGEVQALIDGLLFIRYLFGFEGDALVQDAQSSTAVRKTALEITLYVQQYQDSDWDGSADAFDAFPHDADEIFDTDADGSGNNTDFDDDGDGILDIEDAWPLIALDGRLDTDADGRPDSCDAICAALGMTADEDDDGDGIADLVDTVTLVAEIGHPTFLSPHGKAIAINENLVYVVNTPDDTLDVIDIGSQQLMARIQVGVDPVAVTVRPDGREVWVSNHVSDTVSVVDTDPASATYQSVIATIQDLQWETLSTRFDEPIGIAFADNQKAYVALGPGNEIAIVDVGSYTVSGRLGIAAQDPRSITVKNDRLYVIPFESNNQTQLSGCLASKIDGDTCTYDAVEHAFTNNNVLSLNYDADIVKNPELPDRDLFIFDTETDQLVEVVEGLGTLLYDLTVDNLGRVFIAQTDARNTANGRSGTLKEGLDEMQNRAFLNQVTRLDCLEGSCLEPIFYDLEPRPPENPDFITALATPYGIQVSADDKTLVGTAAGSDKVFTMDAATGEVLGQVGVGSVPRALVLQMGEQGVALKAWVLNAVGNSVSVVDLASLDSPQLENTIVLEDPTEANLKLGRKAFNSAAASSTGTFSCASCHPDGHTDQLLWVLDTPICDVDGCTQVPPRLTMPIRGLRDSEPYHWDGIPGDPFGGNNTANINGDVLPNCELGKPETCARFLVDGSLATTMCDQDDCPANDESKPGPLDALERDALSQFILSFPFPPAPERPFDNKLTEKAEAGFLEFNLEKDCGNCHRMPFLVSTNTPGTGMDAPTWRGAHDRWMILPQGRINVIDLMNIVNMPDHFPEENIWKLAGATDLVWQMVVEGNMGYSGSFARQLTLTAETVNQTGSGLIMDALEQSAAEAGIMLRGEGRLLDDGQSLSLLYQDGIYRDLVEPNRRFSRAELTEAVSAGQMLVTLTGWSGRNVGYAYPQPGLWPLADIQQQSGVINIAHLAGDRTLTMNGRHVLEGAAVIVNGRRVNAEVYCQGGAMPNCLDEIVVVQLQQVPEIGGMHFLQVQNPNGKYSNDTMFFSDLAPIPARPGNIIGSGGEFSAGDGNWDSVQLNGQVDFTNASVEATINSVSSSQPWRVQLNHLVRLVENQEYTLCYQARADAPRTMTAYLDTGADQYQSLSGGQTTVNLTTSYQQFRHTWTVPSTDLTSRVAFDLAQSLSKVYLDNIGLYEGNDCGSP
jgi:YVTN family beta-propeller protein